MPARSLGSRSRRLRDPRDLEGIITSQIVYWRAFFILFHHFRRLKRFNLLNNSRTISQPCAAVRGRAPLCDGRTPVHSIHGPVNHPSLPANHAHARCADAQLGHAQKSTTADEKSQNRLKKSGIVQEKGQIWPEKRRIWAPS